MGPSWALSGHKMAILGPSGAISGHLGAISGRAVLGHLEAILGYLGTILGHLAAMLGPSWAIRGHLMPSRTILVPHWVYLEATSGPCRSHLGAIWGHLGTAKPFYQRLWALAKNVFCNMFFQGFDPLRAISISSRGYLEPSRGQLGVLLARSGAIWGPSWSYLEPSWAIKCPSWALLGPCRVVFQPYGPPRAGRETGTSIPWPRGAILEPSYVGVLEAPARYPRGRGGASGGPLQSRVRGSAPTCGASGPFPKRTQHFGPFLSHAEFNLLMVSRVQFQASRAEGPELQNLLCRGCRHYFQILA